MFRVLEITVDRPSRPLEIEIGCYQSATRAQQVAEHLRRFSCDPFTTYIARADAA